MTDTFAPNSRTQVKEIGFERRTAHYSDYTASSWKKAKTHHFVKKRTLKKYLETVNRVQVYFRDRYIPLPPTFVKIARVIEESKPILSLADGWDDGKGVAISQDIYNTSILFLIEYSKFIYDYYATTIEPPDINPCQNNSIDLSWRTAKTRMLINIRHSDNEVVAFYYGDLYNDKMQIKGNVPIQPVQIHLASWMINLL